MDEKTMVNDILEGVKSGLKTYQGVISEAENMQLRQTIQQIRNNDESFQYELFKVAQTKGYYKPAQSATPTEILTVKMNCNKIITHLYNKKEMCLFMLIFLIIK